MSAGDRVISWPFLVAASVLLVAAAGVHGVLWAKGMHLIKRKAPLQQPLFLIERELGPYQRVEERQLSAEELEGLGTRRYIYWTYADRFGSGRRVRLLLAYHSGMPEARPRVPETVQVVSGRPTGEPRCEPFRVAGIEAISGGDASEGSRHDEPVLCVRDFATAGGEGSGPVPVAYSYIANGRFVGSPEQVHAVLTDPSIAEAWWAKLEIRIEGVTDHAELRTEAERFLDHALPAMAEVLPAMDERR